MKVLLVSPLPPPAGGIAIWTEKYKRYCEEHSIPLAIVNTALIGSRAKRINKNRSYLDEIRRTWRVLINLKHQLKKTRPDVVHLNTSCSCFGIFRDALCVCLIARKRIPVIVHCRCNIQDQLHGEFAIGAFRRMAQRADCILTLNQSSYEYANTVAPGRVKTVPNYIEAEMLNDRFKAKECIEDIVFVGHVQKTKGANEIISAAARFPDIVFTLVGPVQTEIAAMECPDNVRLLGDQPQEQVMELLKKSDVFLFPSYTEGFANAVAEAMASGLPIIATDVGANKEMIEDRGGIIVPIGDSDAIVTAIRRLESQNLRRSMSSWNIEKVRCCYLRDKVMTQLFAIYEGVIA